MNEANIYWRNEAGAHKGNIMGEEGSNWLVSQEGAEGIRLVPKKDSITCDAGNKQWIETDSLQWVRQTDATTYEVIDVLSNDGVSFWVGRFTIDVTDYTEADLQEECEIFGYNGSTELIRIYGLQKWMQIAAECIAENLTRNGEGIAHSLEEVRALLDEEGISCDFSGILEAF